VSAILQSSASRAAPGGVERRGEDCRGQSGGEDIAAPDRLPQEIGWAYSAASLCWVRTDSSQALKDAGLTGLLSTACSLPATPPVT